jgi:hypothetical protein
LQTYLKGKGTTQTVKLVPHRYACRNCSGIRNGPAMILSGLNPHLLNDVILHSWLLRLLPKSAMLLAGDFFGANKGMDNYRGRQKKD